jgi:hypothetical protein
MNFINPNYGDLQELARAYKDTYRNADPFPNIFFKNFFNEDMLNEVLEEFEDLDKGETLKFNSPNEVKLASKGENRFGPKAKAFVHYLNSEPFLLFLQELTSIDETLVPDPYLEGGGFHQTKAGGFLKIHADFNKHRLTKLDRRLNILVYLNKDWKDEYGGHFEMWDKDMKDCVKKVAPEFATMAMFSTTDFSYHGLPNPLTCPPDRSRKSIALYYYSNGRPAHEINEGLEDHNTLFKARKNDTVDAQMKSFNAMQSVKNIVKDLTPPIFFRVAKKVMNGSEH